MMPFENKDSIKKKKKKKINDKKTPVLFENNQIVPQSLTKRKKTGIINQVKRKKCSMHLNRAIFFFF